MTGFNGPPIYVMLSTDYYSLFKIETISSMKNLSVALVNVYWTGPKQASFGVNWTSHCQKQIEFIKPHWKNQPKKQHLSRT